MNDIELYGYYYVANDLDADYTYIKYLNIAVEIQTKGLLCVPYDKIVVHDTFVRHMTGAVDLKKKLFQFRCRLNNICLEELENIRIKMNSHGFYYTSWDYSKTDRNISLQCFESKNDKVFNKLMLLSKNEIKIAT